MSTQAVWPGDVRYAALPESRADKRHQGFSGGGPNQEGAAREEARALQAASKCRITGIAEGTTFEGVALGRLRRSGSPAGA